MKIIQPLFIGISYLCLFRSSKVTGELLKNIEQNQSKMADCTNPGKPNDYEAGSSSVAFVTTPDEASAKKIAHGVIDQKLAACVNIIPQITSIYHWEGKINEDSEVLLMIKTRSHRVDQLATYVRENHPYSVAEVISLPIENGNLPYLKWIADTVPDKK